MERSIFVSLPNFRVNVKEDGKIVRTISKCSFGRPGHLTPIIKNGSLSLTKRDRLHHSNLYGGAPMPFALFFQQDLSCAFHEGNTAVASHGCIHLGHDDAKWLFEWAATFPVAVDMEGPYPTSPVAPASDAATS